MERLLDQPGIISRPMASRLPRPFRGVISAPFMPMNEDESIDWASLERYIDWVASQRPAAIAVNMDAAEAPALTSQERLDVLRRCVRVIDGRAPVISGLIGGSTAGMIRHGLELVAEGAEGFCVFPPLPVFIGSPISAEMIGRFHGEIGAALDRPLIAFQFPRGWGPDYSGEMLTALAEIPQVIAIKESSFDANQTIQTVHAVAALDNPIGVLTGSDTFIFEAMLMGCGGALIGFAGTAVAELVAMQDAVHAGELQRAKEIWDRLGPIARFCWRAPIRDFRPRMKELLVMQGLIRTASVRRPQLGITAHEREELRRLAATAGLI
ncbi:dihydrodipicolinate synthase family protein [Mesorhizobium sp. AD1-1]|uniref:dihydrodipicolinate synthase family protein n=1 Tax=Mesorhizobium sp. AD1-1 TaxID=2876621 RepID=UPI001CCE5389|nr:dihydrodipicolinate synthase family protein [Mesorhizobium sp. AD1-1]MBZ9719234.1 dihydrodipicolinate synthase family protein [Mesorhizobium sp. AD1-1]